MEIEFDDSIKAAYDYYESIEKYEDRLIIRNEFESAFDPEYLHSDREMKFYKWISENIL